MPARGPAFLCLPLNSRRAARRINQDKATASTTSVLAMNPAIARSLLMSM
jgi:hypothetical protein